MVRRQNMKSSNNALRRRTRKIQQIPPSSISSVRQTPSEHLDDETKLAKRHLTKEMWQLVSIAVKRMADELVSISNNQQATATTRTIPQESPTMPTSDNQQAIEILTNSSIQKPENNTVLTDTGAGDIASVHEKPSVAIKTIKKRTLSFQMLEPSLPIKKKTISNNAIRRAKKSKVQRKTKTQHLYKNKKIR